eukprot:TRINITY_DN5713_c0_g1_i1.p1 TRINITY_DN5713_c0_g1~~TRINITY_DN5713_c0_g1_i1.p1  ORF type:complete len:1139 (-),score=226.25 TRINITY_DN5713_c0_g1_i1:86-3502(-)
MSEAATASVTATAASVPQQPHPTPYFPSSSRQRGRGGMRRGDGRPRPQQQRKEQQPSDPTVNTSVSDQPVVSTSSASTPVSTFAPAAKTKRRAPKPQKWKSKDAPAISTSSSADSNAFEGTSSTSTSSYTSAPPTAKMNPNSLPFVPASYKGSTSGGPTLPSVNNGAKASPSSSSSSSVASKGRKTKMPPRSKASLDSKSGDASSQPKSSRSKAIDINPDLTPLSAQITQKLLNNTYECLICFENIGRSAIIFTCSNCYTLYHISCIKKWSASLRHENKPWRCPSCQNAFTSKPVGSCFCGKVDVADFNPYLVPHSCGELCGRFRTGTDCPHPCNLICHPGPCPPCSAVGEPKPCFCGKTKFPLRCGELYKGKSCGGPCGRTRACGLHFCDDICHPGPCADCKVKFSQECYCGRKREERYCGSGQLDSLEGREGTFSCEETCNRTLDCGNHKCLDLCHPGHCKPCETDVNLIQRCPCGWKDVASILGEPRKSCLDPIPVCNSVCGKLLKCGLHMCPNKCHLGPCQPCQTKINVTCRCGSTTMNKICSTVNPPTGPLLCDKTCNTLRNCGRHRCNNKCCAALRDPNDPEAIHICRLTCGKKMSCGVHKCELLCHKGRCPPCNMASYNSLRCRCGKTVRNPPIPCGDEIPPDCPHPCSREHACDHQIIHNCHNNEECPPCVVLVSKPCMGKHEVRKNIPCYVKEVSCGKLCEKTLSCGMHTCKRMCHNPPCTDSSSTTASTSSTSPFTSCGQACGKERQACEHACQAKCHPGQPCPNTVCREMTTIKCACGRTSGKVFCMRGGEGFDYLSPEQRVWPCDDRCEIEKRNKKLAEALGVNPAAVLATKPPPYSANLLSAASSPFIKKLEKVFENLINSDAATYCFPPMNISQRQIIHELAFFYGIDSAAYDQEPRRNVIVTKRRDSKIPSVLLSAVPQYQYQSQLTELSLFDWLKGKPCLHIFDLSVNVKTQHLATLFKDFSVHIRWLDENNALVVFSDETTIKTALNLHPPTTYKYKYYKDVADFDLTPYKAAMMRPAYPKMYPSPSAATIDVWQKNEDFFKKVAASSVAAPSSSSSSSTWEEVDDNAVKKTDILSMMSSTTVSSSPPSKTSSDDQGPDASSSSSSVLNFSTDDWSTLADD